MKRLLTILVCLLLAAPAHADESMQLAWMSWPMLGASGGGAVLTCQSYEDRSSGQDDSYIFGSTTSNVFIGQGGYTPYPSGTQTICAVTVIIADRIGTIFGISYQVEIHELSGDNLASTEAPGSGCTSTARTDISQTVPASYKFEGLSCSITAPYAVVLTRTDHSYDGSNAAYIGYKSTATTNYAGNFARYNSSGTYDAFTGEASLIIWTMQ